MDAINLSYQIILRYALLAFDLFFTKITFVNIYIYIPQLSSSHGRSSSVDGSLQIQTYMANENIWVWWSLVHDWTRERERVLRHGTDLHDHWHSYVSN